jgi:hypothetical protein
MVGLGLVDIEHPVDAKFISEHTETLCPVRFLHRHNDIRPLGCSFEQLSLHMMTELPILIEACMIASSGPIPFIGDSP